MPMAPPNSAAKLLAKAAFSAASALLAVAIQGCGCDKNAMALCSPQEAGKAFGVSSFQFQLVFRGS